MRQSASLFHDSHSFPRRQPTREDFEAQLDSLDKTGSYRFSSFLDVLNKTGIDSMKQLRFAARNMPVEDIKKLLQDEGLDAKPFEVAAFGIVLKKMVEEGKEDA